MSKAIFQTELNKIFDTELLCGKSEVVVKAGDLQKRTGIKDRTPSCCGVMRKVFEKETDSILEEPSKGNGTRLTIRYVLPRSKQNIISQSSFYERAAHNSMKNIAANFEANLQKLSDNLDIYIEKIKDVTTVFTGPSIYFHQEAIKEINNNFLGQRQHSITMF